MKKLELTQMENLTGGNFPALCAMAGFLFGPAHIAGPGFGGMARAIGSSCMNN